MGWFGWWERGCVCWLQRAVDKRQRGTGVARADETARQRAGGSSKGLMGGSSAHLSLGILAQGGDVGQVVDVEVSEGKGAGGIRAQKYGLYRGVMEEGVGGGKQVLQSVADVAGMWVLEGWGCECGRAGV